MLRMRLPGPASILVLAASAAFAQAPSQPAGPAAEVQRAYAGVKANILKAADAMPAADLGFRPAPEMRTFARVVNHITEAQMHACGVAAGKSAAPDGGTPADTADKAAIVQALQASFTLCDQAFAALTDANLADSLASGPSHRSRIGLLWGTVSHDNEQYASLALYLRLKGHTPPSAEK
jgi:hypothetical protein